MVSHNFIKIFNNKRVITQKYEEKKIAAKSLDRS